MSLTMEHMRNWVEDLAGKNQILQSKNHELEEEVKILKLKNQKLTDELHRQKMSHPGPGPRVVSQYQERMNPPPRKQRKITGVSTNDQQMPSVIGLQAVAGTKIATVNTLEMEKILGHVMGYVRPSDLLNCRRVSKLWKKAAEKDFQERMTFHIQSYPYRDSVKKFMEYRGNVFPVFRNLSIDLGGCWPEIKKAVRQLFLTYGNTLHKLKLNFCGPSPIKYWNMNDLRDILATLEEIRELHIDDCKYNPLLGNQIFLPRKSRNVLQNLSTLVLALGFNCIDSGGDKTEFFLDLFSLAPNLKTLIWGSHEKCQGEQLIKCLMHVNPTKLENLDIRNYIPESSVQNIANSRLILKQIELSDYKNFQLKLVSNPSGKSEVTPNQTLYGHGGLNSYLKRELESILGQSSGENVSCTGLLQIFISAVDTVIQE